MFFYWIVMVSPTLDRIVIQGHKVLAEVYLVVTFPVGGKSF